ncbi:MAG: DUF2303 family protein [Rubrivivax sp.]|nr:DUF2303 family protein [Rubrivivax sp.]
MFDREAIQQLSEAEAISAAQVAVDNAIGENALHAIAALPAHFTVHDLEQRLPLRRRARGTMTTSRLEDFAAYAAAHLEDGAITFVHADQMQAVAVLNLGTPAKPGHADNLAIFKPATTAAYDAIKAIESAPNAQRQHTQTKLAEWLEDWAECITCFDADAQAIDLRKAIAAVRAITIESARKAESVEGQLSSERSAFESVKATARTPLPAFVHVSCEPYAGLKKREFVLRLAVYPDDKGVNLGLRMARAEWHREEMALELASLVRGALAASMQVALGTYVAK